jgi:hypothetical protein
MIRSCPTPTPAGSRPKASRVRSSRLQLGHADTRMTERHYARLAPNYIGETVRANFTALGIVETTNVEPLQLPKRTAR